MATETLDNLVRIEIAADQLSATAHLQPGIAPEALTEQALAEVVEQNGLRITPEVTARLRALAEAYDPASQEPASGVIATGTAPTHGEDGRLEWEPHLDPTTQPQIKTGEDGEVDHYQRSTIRAVREGERIGRLVPPSPATDGCDVKGKPIAARQGKPFALRPDESIRIGADGEITAAMTGAIEYRPGALRITGEVKLDAVDFSTGHVHFRGDVEVRDGVRDCFEVRAEGNITVQGLVEAAHIVAARDVSLGGMAARGKGTLKAGRDAAAKYLDAARVEVARDLRVERETINCHVHVGRNFTSENGAVTGGVLMVGQSCVVGTLGSERGLETTVVLGRIEELERLAALANQMLPALDGRAKRAEEKLDQLRRAAGSRATLQGEEIAALQAAAEAARARMQPLESARERLRRVMEENSRVDLLVRKRLHASVAIYCGTLVATVVEPLKGPVRILLDPERGLLIRDETTSTAAPLDKYARIVEHETYVGPELAGAAAA